MSLEAPGCLWHAFLWFVRRNRGRTVRLEPGDWAVGGFQRPSFCTTLSCSCPSGIHAIPLPPQIESVRHFHRGNRPSAETARFSPRRFRETGHPIHIYCASRVPEVRRGTRIPCPLRGDGRI